MVVEKHPYGKENPEGIPKGGFYPGQQDGTDYGVPQGGVISPVIANIALDGLERRIQQAYLGCTLVRYADDFIVRGPNEQVLQEQIKPVITEFLAERGLELKQEKPFFSLDIHRARI